MGVAEPCVRVVVLRSRILWSCFGALISCPSLAWAETESAPQAFEHEVIVSGETRAERERNRAFKASVAASVVDAEEIRTQVPGSLADGVRTSAPSVSIQQTTPGQGTIYVRGLSGRAVVYAVDGVRLNMAFFRAGNNDYLGLIDPYSAASVIVVPGAASVEYGSDALGGAVLMNTDSPSFRLEEPLTSYRVFQGVTSNPLGTASRVAAVHEGRRFAGQLGVTDYQAGPIVPGGDHKSPNPVDYLGLERDAGDPYVLPLDHEQRGTEFEFYAVDGSTRHRLGGGTELVLKGQYSERPELVRYDQVTPRFKRETPARAERSLLPMSRAMASATLRQRRRAGLFDQAEVQLAWQRIFERRVDRRLDEVCIDPVTDPPLEPETCTGRLRLTPDTQRVYEENSSNAFTLRAEARKANRSQSLSAIAGVDFHHDIVASRTESQAFDAAAPVAQEPRYPDGSTVSEAALFGHLRVRVADPLHVFAGVRGALFVVDMNGRDGEEPAEPFTRTVADAVGSLGVHLELAPGFALVANGARGVRAPNVEDFAALGSRAGGRFQIPNPDVRPEHSYTVDGGIKLQKRRHRAQASVFFTRYADAILLAPTTVGGESESPEGDAYYHSVNAGSVDLVGAEGSFDLALTTRIATFGRVLAMRGTQYNPAETGLPLETPADRIPPVQGELGLRYLVDEKLQLEALAIARAPQRRLNDPINLDDNRIPEGGTPAYATYHARFRYQPDPAVIARISFDNLSDELALDHGSGFYRAGFGASGSLELTLDAK